MADEDEIDILGDFQLDGDSNLYEGGPLVSQNSELLNCDYTIHPQWLLDRPSTNPDNWYDTNAFTSLTEKDQPGEIDSVGHLSTENSITDESGWTEKEKTLLERGIDIFGKSNVRLSQFIGSKTAPEVKYYLKNFYLENHANRKISECVLEGDVLDDAQIPASIEEVIAAVSTAKPTVQVTHHKSRKKTYSTSTSTDFSDKELGREESPSSPRKKRSYVNKTPKKYRRKSISLPKQLKANINPIKFRVQSKLKIPFQKDLAIKQKTVSVINKNSNENEIKKVEITTGHGLAVPICEGEEIIKLKPTSEDSDTDIDVDVELSDDESQHRIEPLQTKSLKESVSKPQTISGNIQANQKQPDKPLPVLKSVNLSEIGESLLNELTSLDEPKAEIHLEHIITDLEKIMNQEYFSGSSTKTPERYLKIRNHILQGWYSQKPRYLNKTISRHSLKNCGDVNSFGKIHYILEQIGAINFGCDQVNYERPLLDILQEWMSAKEKKKQELPKISPKESNITVFRDRNKKKFKHDGEGGYTMSHDENGQIIKHTIVNEDPIVKQKQYIKKPTIRLIYCRPFKDEILQPYKIKINLSTLLIMDFHAHTCLTEVMGLIAGHWIPQNQTLIICHYEPCINMASSATHCDMCPISQAKAAESIHSQELDILGWFHSHPTFAPEPSHQDLATQQSVQKWIGQHKPCIGMILSPFSLNGALIASPFRCLIVDKKLNFEDQITPYKFKVDIDGGDFELEEFLSGCRRVLKSENGIGEKHRVDFRKPYTQNPSVTFLEKYVISIRMQLAKLGTLSKTTCESIIRGITSICSSRN